MKATRGRTGGEGVVGEAAGADEGICGEIDLRATRVAGPSMMDMAMSVMTRAMVSLWREKTETASAPLLAVRTR
jgi:hypothetical protein